MGGRVVGGLKCSRLTQTEIEVSRDSVGGVWSMIETEEGVRAVTADSAPGVCDGGGGWGYGSGRGGDLKWGRKRVGGWSR